MNEIKAIILDVDGTLLNSEKQLLEETKKALMKCQENGIKIILASGRPTSGLTGLATELELDKNDGLLVSYNGSKIMNFATKEELFSQTISVEDGKAVLEHMKKFKVYPMIDKDEYMYVNNAYAEDITVEGSKRAVIQREIRNGNFLVCEKLDLAEFADFELNKILTAGEPEYLIDNHKAMMEPFKDKLNCVFTSTFYFEFTAKGVDKAKALDTVLIPLGYTKENMIAFGDSQNDMTMIDYVGVGVAMDNAVDEVKNVANFVTASNDENGIAKALYKYIPEIFSK